MTENLTPMLAQYQAIKREHEDVILLFRLGDFYEMFGDDAKLAARELDLTLTARELRGKRIPMCGVPYHAVERYLARLLAKGYKAAICDQIGDPKLAKGLVKREVTRILTPGTVVEDFLLDERANNWLLAVSPGEQGIGLAAVDCSTGEFLVTEISGDAWLQPMQDELSRFQPSEVLAPPELANDVAFQRSVAQACRGRVTSVEPEASPLRGPYQMLTEHFGTTSLRGFGCEELPLAISAAALALAYLRETQKTALEQIRGLSTYALAEFMVLDAATRRNLELTQSLREGGKANSLLWLLDNTATPMGARLLRRWLLMPLLDLEQIGERHDAVHWLLSQPALRQHLRDLLRRIQDLERLVSRAAAGTATARELVAMRLSLEALPELTTLLETSDCEPIAMRAARVDLLADLREEIARALIDQPPISVREGGLIREGYHAELDELRQASTTGKDWIASLEQTERERTGIRSLKVGFNQVFGYYLEVTKPNLHLVPSDYLRKQTMTNAERFITPELKEWEARVLGAEEKSTELEYRLFCELRAKVASEAGRVQQTAATLAELDVLACFADLAARRHYTCPQVNEGDLIEIREGRHPVVEATRTSERFVPNDAHIDCADHQILIITGPNMAGKSTYLRQVALIVLMAQIGSFVPAESAQIGVVDRIFTRVGASDDLATGQSTFMVEMNETANILHNATRHSLIMLDEIGRGTSTFDGLSIAWAVAEFLHNHPRMGAKTLFATHYHHLNELANNLPRVKNYRIAVKEEGDQIIFLRKIVPGGTDRSYGIQVARLAGLPAQVIERAKEVLWSLEQQNSVGKLVPREHAVTPPVHVTQLALFESAPNPLLQELAALDVEAMTPLEALNKLAEMRAKAKGRESKRE